MKKLSLIAGLACLATVGGVFGAWVFAGTATSGNTSAQLVSISVDEEVRSVGAITATHVEGKTQVHYSQANNSAGAQVTLTGEGNKDHKITFEDTTDYGSLTATYNCVASFAVTGDLEDYITPTDITVTPTIVESVWTATVTNEAILAKLAVTTPITAANVYDFIEAFDSSTINITFTINALTPVA